MIHHRPKAKFPVEHRPPGYQGHKDVTRIRRPNLGALVRLGFMLLVIIGGVCGCGGFILAQIMASDVPAPTITPSPSPTELTTTIRPNISHTWTQTPTITASALPTETPTPEGVVTGVSLELSPSIQPTYTPYPTYTVQPTVVVTSQVVVTSPPQIINQSSPPEIIVQTVVITSPPEIIVQTVPVEIVITPTATLTFTPQPTNTPFVMQPPMGNGAIPSPTIVPTATPTASPTHTATLEILESTDESIETNESPSEPPVTLVCFPPPFCGNG